MIPFGKSFQPQCWHVLKLRFKFVIPFLVTALASLVGAQNIQTIYSFNGPNGQWPNGLTLGNDGNFYGTTLDGGSSGDGTIFQVTTNGTLTTLFSFNGGNGRYPCAALTLGNDGNFYGVTSGGGSGGYGTIFRVTPSGTLNTLVSFMVSANPGTAQEPYSSLTLGNDGNFYGTTAAGGSGGDGTIFQVTTNGTLTTLASFNGANGANPEAALTLGNDGNFYGTTSKGGSDDWGTVFRVTTNGTLTTLVSCIPANGYYILAPLTLGNDGNFYGTTLDGGSEGQGTIFQVTTNETLTTLVAFNYADGQQPNGPLTMGNDGNFYGETVGGASGPTIFQVTPNGTLTTLASFINGGNSYNENGLTLGTDGNFYGTIQENAFYGTIFRLLLTPAITIQPQSQTNNAGATVTFSVSATSLFAPSLDPTGYQWLMNGTNLLNGGSISGATTNTLTITGISDSDAASYSVMVSNAKGNVSSSNAILTVMDPPSITAQPTNLIVLAGTNIAFDEIANGSAPLFYQWLFNTANLLNATNAIYTIPSASTNNAGNYSVVVSNPAGSVTSSNAALTVVLSPPSRTNYAGGTATFSALSFGPESLNYQWQKNGANLSNGGNISGATTSTLNVATLSDSDAAGYSAAVTSAYGSVTTASATLTVIDPPYIKAQPTNLLVLAGSNVAFGVTLTGSVPLFYQWLFNSANLLNATNPIYTIPSVGTNNAGNYSVAVSNWAGSQTSSNAVLSVVLSPTSQNQLCVRHCEICRHFSRPGNCTLPMAKEWDESRQWRKHFRRNECHLDHRQCFGQRCGYLRCCCERCTRQRQHLQRDVDGA